MLRACLVICAIFGTFGERVSYKGHKVVRVIPQTTQELIILHDLLQGTTTIDVWKSPRAINSSADIRLTPLNYDDVIQGLEAAGFTPSVLIDDVQRLIDEEAINHDVLKFQPKSAPFNYSAYHDLDEIYAWMKNITTVHKDIATQFTVNNSYEGRPLTGIKISTGKNRPAFWIESAIHAREWISPATSMFMAGKMLDDYGTDPYITKMVDEFDWYILPVTNPDGYVFTWEHNRLWRKTRTPHDTPKGRCYGVDPNRNWDYEWCKAGASKDPCSDTYCGPKAFSEIEVRSVAEYLRKIPHIKAFIDFHSYSQLWMSPWGYMKTPPVDFKVQDDGSKTAVDALQKLYGTKYQHGTLASTVYISSGSSADWTYGKANIKFSYGVELRDTGKYGFILPADQILPSGMETLQALIALANYVSNN